MHKLKKIIPQSFKNLYHLLQAILANFRYGFPARRSYAPSVAGEPSRKIRVIGVTGTDGKTTTVQMIAKILEKANRKVAVASTINFMINGKEEKNLSHYTTESPFALQKFIRQAVDAGCEYLVLETSSHALDQHRVWGVPYAVAVITNVTREHLDYHKTMEKYRAAKRELFKNVAKQISVISQQPASSADRSSVIVANAEMERPAEFLNFEVSKKFVYSVKGNRLPMTDDRLQYVYAEEIELGINYSKFKIQNSKFTLSIPGLFNIENAIAAICVALGEGIDLTQASEALSEIKGVAGRMEAVENDLGVNILVDFALTPNALERLYGLLARVKKEGSKIIAILGSCGDRDQGKRPLMGEIVAKYADVVILTNEEPYHEDPQAIIDAIFAGIKNKTENENIWRILDRRQAIAKALSLAKKDDIICITGMGSFETMVVGDEKLPWNDRNVIEEELKRVQ
jgi:UDP-N-acetylmuramoyl-L-alanyl-D-glutamate--2,6-diaminopimelate ligase